MSVHTRSALLSLAVAAALGQVPGAALAQQLEEVVVTARKTQESLQDAPVAVSAVTSREIAELGMRNVNDIASMTSGLSFSQAFGRTTDRPVIRGQSNVLAGVQFGVESGAAYFLDGVYWPGDIQGLDLNALERVEVIKGPQSALYGRNTYSGAINFITAPPTEDVEAYVKASLAQYGEQDYAFSVGSSFFDDKFGARFYARSYETDGQYTNTLTGKKVGSESTDSAGLYLTWKPIEDLKFLTNMIYREDDDGPLALFLQPATTNNCKPGYRSTFYRDPPGAAPRGSNPNQYYCGKIEPGIVALNTDPILVTDTLGQTMMRDGTAFDGVETNEYFGMLRGDWDIMGSGWTLTSLTGYRSFDNKFGTDSDHSAAFTLLPSYNPGTGRSQIPAPGSAAEKEPLFANTNRDVIRSKSQELRLASPQDKAVRGMVGYYWYDYKDQGYDLTFSDPNSGFPDYTETVEDTAIFGMVSWDILTNLTLNVELRYSEETKGREEYCSTAASTGDYNPWTDSCTNWSATVRPGSPTFYNKPRGTVNYKEEEKFDSTTPRITLDWRMNENNMFYIVYAEGAKPGGLLGNRQQADRVRQPVPSEHGDLLDRRLGCAVHAVRAVPDRSGRGDLHRHQPGRRRDLRPRGGHAGGALRSGHAFGELLLHAQRDHQGLRRLRVHAQHRRPDLQPGARHGPGVQHRGKPLPARSGADGEHGTQLRRAARHGRGPLAHLELQRELRGQQVHPGAQSRRDGGHDAGQPALRRA